MNPTSYGTYRDIAERSTLSSGLYATPMFPHAVSIDASMVRGESGSDVGHAYGQSVTTSFFGVLGATPVVGRLFDARDSDAPGASPIVVLSYGFWTRRFSRDPAIVGQTIRVNGQPVTVIGVTAPQFQGGVITASDLWLPLRLMATEAQGDRGMGGLMIGARLKPGVTMAQAAAEIDTIGRQLVREHPDPTGAPRALRLLPSSRVPGNARLAAIFFTFLMIIVSLVLIVACANLAAILLARGAARRREMAVRLAIGAGRARLVRQLLTETVLLFAIGGALGLLIARVMLALFVPLLPALPFPIVVPLTLDARVVAFTAAVSLIAALLCGLAPALQASRADVLTSLNSDSQGPSGRSRLRHAFVVAQVACSLLLVILAGLFVRALQQAGATDPGFGLHGVELATIDPSMGHYTRATTPRFLRELADRLRQAPDVEAVTIGTEMPGGFESLRLAGLTAPGFAPPDGQRFVYPSWNIVEPGYFATLRIPLRAGRDFTSADLAGTQPVIILSESLARRLWPNESPNESVVGKYVMPDGGLGKDTAPLLVVGIVGDIRSSSLIDGLADPFVYVPMQQRYASGPPPVTIAARGAKGRGVSDAIRAVLRSMDPNLPVVSLQSLEESAALGLVIPRLVASVAGGLGSIGVLLAAIGIYGVTAYTVARRGREIGIRIALGAGRRHVVAMVLRQGLWLAGIGSAIGLMLAALAGTVLQGFLFGVPPLDPVSFLGATLLFAAISGFASYVPARRAVRVDPLATLRRE